jgi:hypothetical protein
VPTVVAAPHATPDVRLSMPLVQWLELMQPKPLPDIDPITVDEFDFTFRLNVLERDLATYVESVAKFYDMRRRADLHNLCSTMLGLVGGVNNVAIQQGMAESDEDKARLNLELTTELHNLRYFLKMYRSTIKPLGILD